MLTHDAADDPRASYECHPVEDMEASEDPANEYREAGLKMLVFLHSAFNFVFEAKSQPELVIRFHAVSAAIDHPALSGRPHCDIAEQLGTTRANFSKHVLAFERQNDLPPTLAQKSIKARKSYSVARLAQLNGK